MQRVFILHNKLISNILSRTTAYKIYGVQVTCYKPQFVEIKEVKKETSRTIKVMQSSV